MESINIYRQAAYEKNKKRKQKTKSKRVTNAQIALYWNTSPWQRRYKLISEKGQVHWSYITSNKYIILSIETCATHDKSHNSQLK